MLNYFLQLLLLVPVAGFLLSLLLRPHQEKWISRLAYATVGLHLASYFVFLIVWLSQGAVLIDVKDLTLYDRHGYAFFIDLYFDSSSAVYLFVGGMLTLLVTVYSRVYLHREKGYKRFFNTLLFFYVGFSLVVLSGNLETLFIGWEILGISSYLLIAFYRERFLPVRNAMKVYSIYRLGDVGLIAAMWMIHHLFHSNITFHELHNTAWVNEHLDSHTWVGIGVSLMLLVAAAAKSAQFPFSSWLPRAMEGPTPSSAIFYGSISVHLGVFLLLRTFPFWEHQLSVRILIGGVGLLTSVLASGAARVQSSVKAQIAYGSMAQIGLIFIEVAAGLHWLALVHFAGNAFMRTYQLLVSPSVVSYLIREQFYRFKPRPLTVEDSMPRRLQYTLYIWSLKEFNLDSLIHKLYWKPLKWMGGQLRFLSGQVVALLVLPLWLVGAALWWNSNALPESLVHALPPVCACLGLLLVARSFTERQRPALAWSLILLNHCWIALAVSFNERFDLWEVATYLSGVLLSWVVGMAVLSWLSQREADVSLAGYKGHAYEHPRLALIFLIASLGLTGFPITPTFIGEDLIYSHIHEHQIALALLTSLSMVIDGIAAMRIYNKLFLGPHVKTYHERAYKSS